MRKLSLNEQPDKFFADAETCLAYLRGIPVIAIDRLKIDESSRDVIISILRTCYQICSDAGLDIMEEIEKQDLRDSAEDNLKELMRDDNPVTMEGLKKRGLKLAFTDNGPIIVPA